MEQKKIKVVSLFSGCGGLDLGFKEEGFDIVWANDFSPESCKTYQSNINNNIICKDILEIDIKSIPKADIVIGGPPCQGFSGIGKRNPLDPRSKLVWQYLKIIEHLRPKVFLVENVCGIKSAKFNNGKSVLDTLVNSLKKFKYNVGVFTLNAADYGVPQRRKRVFILGTKGNLKNILPEATHSIDNSLLKKWVSVEEATGDLPTPSLNGEVERDFSINNDFLRIIRKNSEQTKVICLHMPATVSKKEMEIIRCVPPGGNYLSVPDEIATPRILSFKKARQRTTTYGRLLKNMPSYTLTTSFNKIGIGCNIHYSEDRVLTIREGARLQSFPDSFIFHAKNKSGYYSQIGNAVPPLLGSAWAKQIKKIILKDKI